MNGWVNMDNDYISIAAPASTTHLDLDKDIPSDTNWNLLSSHFTSVTHLLMESGYNEKIGDEGIPLHWPLQKLTISSACGDVCTSPWIIEGRVRHLVFNYTAGLRFEGPKTDELVRTHKTAIANGEKEGAKSGGLTIVYVPDLVNDWMREKYADLKEDESNDKQVEAGIINNQLRTLEIIHNDAQDTLFRYILAKPSLIDPVETLNVVAGSPHDLDMAPGNFLGEVLTQLTALKTLLPSLVRLLPPNLEVLRFRSSVSLAGKPESFDEWVKAFGDPQFLPNLKSLSFVLDLEDGETQSTAEVSTSLPEPKVSDAVLAQAKGACERLWRAVEFRGVVVEPFGASWSKDFTGILPVDERWEKL
ncbi:hypothetical protein BDP27DRAFT_1392835 [Rhodocollybia butyracea]|uniref:Uncharacterized protein n=1 Tax=Rhodocollybia butyracea TaxID=206335 RepID=A0A9P5PQG3_9AGAR|nr:hypothetical protein BDP27DRAFT_1392835 [Rhodocollybia butyracea]